MFFRGKEEMWIKEEECKINCIKKVWRGHLEFY